MAILPPPGFEDGSVTMPQTVAINPKMPVHPSGRLPEPGLPNAMRSSIAEENLDLMRENAELKEQIALMENAHLIRQNAELMGRLAWMSTTVTFNLATSQRMEGRAKANAKSGFERSKGVSNSGVMKITPSQFLAETSPKNHFLPMSRGNSTASTTSSTTAGTISSRDEGNDMENSIKQDELRRTTVIIRNIPTEFTRADVLGVMDGQGFNGLYDMFYLPVDFGSELNHGYAFANFTSAKNAKMFQEHFIASSNGSGQNWEVTFSDRSQGIDANIKHYRDSPMMHASVEDRFKPVFFQAGKRVPFPKPTKKIRPPRRRIA